MKKTKYLLKKSKEKRIANGANETVEWRRKTDNQSRSSSSSTDSGSSNNKRTKSIDLFTTCPLVRSCSWISALYGLFVLFDYIVWHSNNVPIRRAYCCVELYCIMVSCACVCVYGWSRSQHTLHSWHIRALCMHVWVWFDRRESKKTSITNFPFHSFASFTLLISFILWTNKHIDGRTDRRTSCWAMWMWCIFKIHWSFGWFPQHLIVCRVFFPFFFCSFCENNAFHSASLSKVYSFSLTTKSNTKHTQNGFWHTKALNQESVFFTNNVWMEGLCVWVHIVVTR